MSNNLIPGSQPFEADIDRPLYVPIKRRSFFMYAGATAGATALVLAGCSKDDNNSTTPGTVNVGSGDVGVLNYAYALEQLEAAFYTQLRTGTYYTTTATAAEKAILDDLYYHEVIHRDFFQTAITKAGATPIQALKPNFGTINFNDRTSVLSTAKAFEDLGVSAYNGAGQYITSPGYLAIAGKIVSVEARHAAIIRDLVAENTFVGNDVLTITSASTSSVATNNAPANSSLERAMSPTEVVAMANNFLMDGSKLDVSGIK
ncbi:MAG: ferritin-like domain-containing protein [Janthinobacterium lividum]